MSNLRLILQVWWLPRHHAPLFHYVHGHWRVDSSEFTARLISRAS